MSRIKRLTLSGIRNFEPNDESAQSIKFGSPLSLIVGKNGSGKTTIIEALKYALTSEYPPGTLRGHSFVNDPKFSNGIEVNAMIKLEVVDLKGDVIVVTKRLKASQTGSMINIKSLDGTIHKENSEGEKLSQISGRSIDITEEMCRVMGVSDSVLNNVIFCHQEDSCWPLDEAKKVKEKFDAIFNTTHYSKIFDHLTKAEKDIQSRVRIYNQGMNLVKRDMLHASEKREKLDNLNARLQEDSDQLVTYENELDDVSTKLQELEEMQSKHNKAILQVSQLKDKITSSDEEMERLKNSIKETYDGSIEDLEGVISQYGEKFQEKQASLGEIEKVLRIKKGEIIRLNVLKENFLKDEGVYEEKLKDNDAILAKMNEEVTVVESLVNKIKVGSSQEYMTAFDSFLRLCSQTEDKSEIDLKPVEENIELMLMFKESSIRSQFDVQEKELQDNINAVRAKKTSLEKEIEMKETNIKEHEEEIVDLKQRLEIVSNAKDTLAQLNAEEATLNDKILAIEDEGVLLKCEGKVKLINEEETELDEKLNMITQRVEILTADEARLEKIKFFNEQKGLKEKACDEILGQIDEKLRTVLGHSFDDENIGKDLDDKIKSMRKEIKDKDLEIKRKEYESTKYQAEVKYIIKELAKKESNLNDWNEVVAASFEGRSFDVFFKEVTEKLDGLQKSSYYSDASQFLFKKYIHDLNSKDCCPLCKRNFENPEETKCLVSEIEKDIETLIKNAPSEKAIMAKTKVTLKNLTDMKPLYEMQKKIEDVEIPEMKKRKDELEFKIASLKITVEALAADVLTLKGNLTTALDLTKVVSVFDQHKKELKKIEESIAKIEGERDPRVKECSRSLSEIQSEVQNVNEQIKSKRQERNEVEEVKNKTRDEMAKLQEEKNNVLSKRLNINSEMQNREMNFSRVKELEETIHMLKLSIQELNENLPLYNADITKHEEEKSNWVAQKEGKIEEIRLEKDVVEKQFSKVNDLQNQIQEFEKHKLKHFENQQRFDELKSRLSEAESVRDTQTENMDTIKNEINTSELKERDLKDNLTYKKRQIDIVTYREDLATHEKLVEETKLRDGLEEDITALTSKLREVNANINKLKGSRKQKLEYKEDLESELKTNRLSKADETYRDKLVRKTVYERAQNDLKKYKASLEFAILQFHKKRMEAINRKLKILWRDIYKGNDIQFIEIKCDDEEDLGYSPYGRKNYNYRVIMSREGYELDMRSRCSAGQKLLASLIIRIAIAEAFSSKCGIITLDEPTTNLDQENIDGLAETLADITQAMSENSSFQMVVITHDELFIERLFQANPIEFYYEVSRDNMGHSLIKQVGK